MLLKSTVQLGLGWVFCRVFIATFSGGFTRKNRCVFWVSNSTQVSEPWILVRGSVPPCHLTSQSSLISLRPHPIQKTALFCTFSLFNFFIHFSRGVSWPHLPLCAYAHCIPCSALLCGQCQWCMVSLYLYQISCFRCFLLCVLHLSIINEDVHSHILLVLWSDRKDIDIYQVACLHYSVDINYVSNYTSCGRQFLFRSCLFTFCLLCFETVGSAAGRAYGLWKSSDKVLVCLSVWTEVQIVCIWSSWCHCIPKPYSHGCSSSSSSAVFALVFFACHSIPITSEFFCAYLTVKVIVCLYIVERKWFLHTKRLVRQVWRTALLYAHLHELLGELIMKFVINGFTKLNH